MIHGYGTMKWVQVMTYTGNFEDGYKSGLGIESKGNTIYVGYWKNNFKHGRAILCKLEKGAQMDIGEFRQQKFKKNWKDDDKSNN